MTGDFRFINYNSIALLGPNVSHAGVALDVWILDSLDRQAYHLACFNSATCAVATNAHGVPMEKDHQFAIKHRTNLFRGLS